MIYLQVDAVVHVDYEEHRLVTKVLEDNNFVHGDYELISYVGKHVVK